MKLNNDEIEILLKGLDIYTDSIWALYNKTIPALEKRIKELKEKLENETDHNEEAEEYD